MMMMMTMMMMMMTTTQASVGPGAPGAHPANKSGDLGIIRIEQVALPDQRVLDLAGELEPLLARARAEIAERTDRLLPRSFRRLDRFDQHVVEVGSGLVGANRFADVHIPLYILNHPIINE